MPNFKNSVSVLQIFILLFAVILTGCSGSRELTREESERLKKDANGYKTEEIVSTSTLKQKASIDKSNLESISSTIADFMSTYNLQESVSRDEVMFKVIEYLNTPYLWGGTTKRGIDCSAFVQTVMYQALGIMIPRTSIEQSGVGVSVAREELKFGDLVFFDTMRKGRVTHVGIYLSDDFFVHSGSKTGVIVASLNTDFYARTYLGAKRVSNDEDLK
jgi:cell wall-associated NlpC family hydrolase